MSGTDGFYEKILAKIHEDEKALVRRKLMLNQFAEEAGISPPFPNVSDADSEQGVSLSIRSDQFYGQPQATCVRAILQMRKALDKGPATVNEIYAALLEGGYAFDTSNEENRKRGLRISITKNTALFHKLPNGKIGLLEWYPNAKKGRKSSAAASTLPNAPDEADEQEEGDE